MLLDSAVLLRGHKIRRFFEFLWFPPKKAAMETDVQSTVHRQENKSDSGQGPLKSNSFSTCINRLTGSLPDNSECPVDALGEIQMIRCPSCDCRRTHRSRSKGLLEKWLLAMICVRPFRCEQCDERFFAWSLRKIPNELHPATNGKNRFSSPKPA